jgi:hypothetical protein
MKYWKYSLTSIRNVEEECHCHHCEPKKKKMGVGETSGLLVANKQVVAPSVRLSAIRNNANGGIPKRALSVAKAAERKTKGATILKIWVTIFSLPIGYCISWERGTKATHEEGCHQEWVKFRN